MRRPTILRPSPCGEAQASHVKRLHVERPDQPSAIPAMPAPSVREPSADSSLSHRLTAGVCRPTQGLPAELPVHEREE